MKSSNIKQTFETIQTLDDLALFADYSFVDTLECDPDATQDGIDCLPRQVFIGHYVPVVNRGVKNLCSLLYKK